jgi:hypothetical protein
MEWFRTSLCLIPGMLEQCTSIVIGFDNFNLKSIPGVSNVRLVVKSCKTNNISRWVLNDYIPWGSHHENEESWAATLASKGLESLLAHWCSCTLSERYLSSVHWWGAVCLRRICATWCHKQILIPYSWVSCRPVEVRREAGSSLFDKKVCCFSCMDADRRRAFPLQPCQHAKPKPGPFSGLPNLTFGAKLLYLLNLHQCFLIFIIKDTHLRPPLLNPLRDIIEKITKQYVSLILKAASATSSLKYFGCWSCRICKSSARSRCYLAQVPWRVPTHNVEWISCLEALI